MVRAEQQGAMIRSKKSAVKKKNQLQMIASLLGLVCIASLDECAVVVLFTASNASNRLVFYYSKAVVWYTLYTIHYTL